MKAHSIPLNRYCLPVSDLLRRKNWPVASPLKSILVTLAAALPATAIAVMTIFAFSSQAQAVAAAGVWATSFVFLALSVESSGSRSLLLGVSALVLMLLAWLSTRLAVEFGMLAGFMVAAWVAFAVSTQLLHPANKAGASNEPAEPR